MKISCMWVELFPVRTPCSLSSSTHTVPVMARAQAVSGTIGPQMYLPQPEPLESEVLTPTVGMPSHWPSSPPIPILYSLEARACFVRWTDSAHPVQSIGSEGTINLGQKLFTTVLKAIRTII